MPVTTFLDELRLIVGADHVLDADVDRFGYSYDYSFLPLVPARKPDLVVTDCASCGGALKHLASHFQDDPLWRDRAAEASGGRFEAMHISQVL